MQGGSALTGGTAVPGFYATGNVSFDWLTYYGKTIYTFITNGTTLDASNATQFALISFAGVITITPDVSAPPIPNVYSVDAGSGNLVYGKTGPIAHSDLAGDYRSIQLQTVPEPSVALLGLLGATSLMRRRR